MKAFKVIVIILLVLALLGGLGYFGWKYVYPKFFVSMKDYTLADNISGQLQIMKYVGDAEKLTIPAEHDGKVVAEIDSFAFDAGNLREVSISAGLTKLHLDPFLNCPALEQIRVAEDNAELTSVDGVLFSKDGKTLLSYPRGRQGSYSVPEGVEVIAPFAFAKALALTDVTFPNSVRTIGSSAFQSCSSLKTVVLPPHVTTIGDNAFKTLAGIQLLVTPDSETERIVTQMGFSFELTVNAAE